MILKIKSIITNICLTVVSLFIVFMIGEFIARIVLSAPYVEKWPLCNVQPDSTLGWRMLPNHFHYTYTFPVNINSLGLRYKEIKEKKDNEFRILVLGDSHVYGQGISSERLFTHLLEKQLNTLESEYCFSAINAGVRAYSINQEIAFLEHSGLALNPDLVIVCFYINDFEIPDIKKTFLTKKRINDGDSYVFDLSTVDDEKEYRRWRLVQFFRQFRSLMYIYDGFNAWRARNDYRARILKGAVDEEIRERIQQVDCYFQRFNDLLTRNRVHGLIVVIPVASQISQDFPDEIYQSTILSLAQKYHLNYFDLLPAFKRRYAQRKRLPIIPFDGHYDDTAHEVIAGALFEYIEKNWRYNEHSRDFSVLPR